MFLNKVTGLAFAANEIAALEERTEGWIAGLQMAAISMQGRADVPGFIKAFAGDDRYIVDYLVEEVLRRQPEPVRHFLLQTSILDRLGGPLCEAVTDKKQGGALLQVWNAATCLSSPWTTSGVVPLPPLVWSMCQARLMKEQPEATAALHQRASGWYEGHGLTAAAVYHAFAADDMARAARITELAWGEMDRNRQDAARMAGVGQKASPTLWFSRPARAQRGLCLEPFRYWPDGGGRRLAAPGRALPGNHNRFRRRR
ncbi:MAG: hypothetical protein IPJ94_16715 [Chloroflexi bacterium]|nr:hypothetical protein [Chloroflexota bacterium]